MFQIDIRIYVISFFVSNVNRLIQNLQTKLVAMHLYERVCYIIYVCFIRIVFFLMKNKVFFVFCLNFKAFMLSNSPVLVRMLQAQDTSRRLATFSSIFTILVAFLKLAFSIIFEACYSGKINYFLSKIDLTSWGINLLLF